MKKSRIERVKKYSMLSLIEDLGFTLVYESSNYYHLEEHDSLKIRVNINRFYWTADCVSSNSACKVS